MSVLDFTTLKCNKLMKELKLFIDDTSELFDMYDEDIMLINDINETSWLEIERVSKELSKMGLNVEYVMEKEYLEVYKAIKEGSVEDIEAYKRNKLEEIEQTKCHELENLVKAFKELYEYMPMLEQLSSIEKISYVRQEGITGTFNEIDEETYIFLSPNLEYDELLLTLTHIYGNYIYSANVYEEEYANVYGAIYTEYKKLLLEEKGLNLDEAEHFYMDSQSEIIGVLYEMLVSSRKGWQLDGQYMVTENSYNRIYHRYMPYILGEV